MNIRLVGQDNITQYSVAEDVEEYGFDPYQQYFLPLIINYISFYAPVHLHFYSEMLLAIFMQTPLYRIVGKGRYKVYNLLVDGLTVKNSSENDIYGVNVFGIQ